MGSVIGRVTSFWSGLQGPSRRLLVFAFLIFVVGLFLLFRLSGSATYSTLVADAEPADAASITAKLREMGIPYKLGDGGMTIQVPSDKLDQARLDLAQSNLISGGGVGFEIFDRQSLGATDFTQRVNLVRAMEGELARTIGRLEPVRSATVRIAMPQDRLFSDDEEPTTASVLLDLETGQTLDPGQVRGIANLTAMAVPGLTPERITITDSRGNILNGAGADAEVEGANQRLAAEAAYERSAQARLDAMLATIVGPGNAVAQVDAVLNLDRTTTDSETFRPESATPLERSTSRETLRSTGGAPGAPAGATPNTPGATTTPANGNTGTTNYDKTTTETRNGVDHTRTQIISAPGGLERQSISVQVSDKVPAATVRKLEAAVAAAVGFREDRDTINVQSMPFAQPAPGAAPAGDAAGAEAGTDGGGLDLMGVAKTGGAALGVVVLLLLARRSLRRRQSALEKALPELLAHGPVPVAELDAGAPAPSPAQLEGRNKSELQKQMEELAMRKPEDVAQLLRGWLIESGR